MIRPFGPAVVITVNEASQVGEARRRGVELAARLGFDEAKQSTIALIVTEAATNLIKHSGGGQVVLEGLTQGPDVARLEILILDSGKGMTDVARCLADGYSTAGSSGFGLGAIGRLADEFEIYTRPEKGTIVRACVNLTPPGQAHREQTFELGLVRVCAPGELVCGDDWAMLRRDGFWFILMVDGLGHGYAASVAAEEAVQAFHAQRATEPADLLRAIHNAIRGTRGAAAAIARIDPRGGMVRYAGVGNISGVIVDTATEQTRTMVSFSGTVGHTILKIQSFDYPWTESSLIVMHSDGLGTHWGLDRLPGIMGRHPELIAGALYRDHTRGRDDVCVLVARFAKGECA